MDYGTLANLSQPGAALPGMEWDQIRRYQNLNTINQGALQQAIPLAEMSAQKSRQENEEYMAGAPGRMNNINLSNMTAAAGVKNFDRDQALKDLDAQLQDADKRAKLADVTQDIAGDADAYLTGDPRIRKQIIQKNTGRKLRNGYVIGTDPNTDDMLFEIAGRARANAPVLQNKLAVEDRKAANRLTIENLKNLNSKEQIELRGQIAAKLQGQRIEAQKNEAAKPLSASQALAAHLNGLYGDDHESWLKAYSLIQVASTTLKIDEKAAALRMFPELAKRMGEPAAPRELPPGNPNAAPAPKQPAAAKPNAVPVSEALSKLNGAKGTKDEERFVKYFVDVYGAAALPDWAKKK